SRSSRRPAPARRSWSRSLCPSGAVVFAVAVGRLRVVRGGKPVLPDMTFTVESGTVTGLLGPSGSGKTTVMRAIVGVQLIAGGRVEVLGAEAGSPPLRRRVGHVTQAPSVCADPTGRESLAYFGKVLGAPPDRVDRALGIVDLGTLEGRIARTLSGGELSRTSLATALLGEPELLVLDEPTVGLDPVLRRDLWSTFRELADGGRHCSSRRT